MSVWFALLGPAGLPADVVRRIVDDAAVTLRQPRLVESLSVMGAEPFVRPTQEFARLIDSESRKWGEIVQKSGAKLD